MTHLLSLLLLLAPAGGGLSWQVHVGEELPSVGAIEVRAYLQNLSKRDVPAPGGPAPELVLTPRGKDPIRKPLPEEAQVYEPRGAVRPGQIAWQAIVDLRHAFGVLAPGMYEVRVGDSAPVAFEIVKTSLAEARAKAPPQGDLELKIGKDGTGVLTNRGKRAVSIWAYGDKPGQTLSSLVMAEFWSGRAWIGSGGGFCGTGLVDVKIAPGESRKVELPPHRDGIVRFTLDAWREGKGGRESLRAVSEAILVDTFPGK